MPDYRPVTVSQPQATQRAYDGTWLYRWYVWIPNRRTPVVTWAPTERAARAKRAGVRRVEPAPSIE